MEISFTKMFSLDWLLSDNSFCCAQTESYNSIGFFQEYILECCLLWLSFLSDGILFVRWQITHLGGKLHWRLDGLVPLSPTEVQKLLLFSCSNTDFVLCYTSTSNGHDFVFLSRMTFEYIGRFLFKRPEIIRI